MLENKLNVLNEEINKLEIVQKAEEREDAKDEELEGG